MSITVTFTRHKDGRRVNPVVNNASQGSAFISLVCYELAFGGTVVEVTPTRVLVRTRVLGCMDDTAFEGSEEEMRLLTETAATYVAVRNAPVPDVHDSVMANVMKITQGSPLLVNLGGDMMFGTQYTHLALAIMIGADDCYQQFCQLRVQDACAVVSLVRYDGVSVQDAMELATSGPMPTGHR